MVTYVLYNKGTAAERLAEDFVDKLKHEDLNIELLDADSPRGIGLAETYDILSRPAIFIVNEAGAPVHVWQAEDGWPLVSEVAYWARQ